MVAGYAGRIGVDVSDIVRETCPVSNGLSTSLPAATDEEKSLLELRVDLG